MSATKRDQARLSAIARFSAAVSVACIAIENRNHTLMTILH